MIWGIYASFVGVTFGIVKYLNFRLHQLFDTTDSVEEVVNPYDTNAFQGGSSFSGIASVPASTSGGNSRSHRVSQSHHHTSHHHTIQHLHDLSPSRRDRTLGTRLGDIQLVQRDYRGRDDDDGLMIGGPGSSGMIELQDLGGTSNKNTTGPLQSMGSTAGYEHSRSGSNASLTDLTISGTDFSSQALNTLPIPAETITIPAETIRERVAAASVMRVCLLYTSPSPRDATLSRMPSSA